MRGLHVIRFAWPERSISVVGSEDDVREGRLTIVSPGHLEELSGTTVSAELGEDDWPNELGEVFDARGEFIGDLLRLERRWWGGVVFVELVVTLLPSAPA